MLAALDALAIALYVEIDDFLEPQSRETVRRGYAGYGYCHSHSRFFWGFQLYLCCAPDGMPIGFELAPANSPEREAAKELLEHVPLAGHVVIADKGFAGADFEGWMANRGAHFLRPDRNDEPTDTARSARSDNGSNRCSGPARANSGWNATAPAPSLASPPASRCAYSRSPPASGTTTTPANQHATSPPTDAD